MKGLKLLLILSIYSLLKFAFSSKCMIYDCASFSNGCAYKSILKNSVKVSLSACEDTEYYCPISASKIGIIESCLKRDVLSFPEASCKADIDCISGSICNITTSKCSPINADGSCLSHRDCNISSACISNKCTQRLGDKSACSSDYECVNTHGCLNGICTKYFSVADTQFAVDTLTYDIPELSFCESGYADSTGQCLKLKLKSNAECTDTNACEYSVEGIPTKTVSLPDACECGYGTLGKQYCKKFAGDRL